MGIWRGVPTCLAFAIVQRLHAHDARIEHVLPLAYIRTRSGALGGGLLLQRLLLRFLAGGSQHRRANRELDLHWRTQVLFQGTAQPLPD